ncbi:MAG: sigma-70 family RNA polymerase sigma factor [Frankiaceae bacterium]|nr:sigma-70 family RNA polymerase sigma factor [Frankiaceae bacterium]
MTQRAGTDVDVAAQTGPQPAELDEDSARWMSSLRSTGARRDQAVADLHALLLRAARFEAGRRAGGMPAADRDDLAMQAADDALMQVLGKLDTFEGRSRFTTWAYKFAIYEAGVKARRRIWQDREVTLEAESWSLIPDTGSGPAAEAEGRELLHALEDGIRTALTPHQRNVLVALAVTGVPIDVLSDRLGTTRGALYKTLHDARRKLRGHLGDQGLAVLADGYVKETR